MTRILLAGGGTLGSVSPLLAVAQKMTDADYLFVGTRSGIERYFVESKKFRYRWIATAKLRRYFSLRNMIDVFKFPYAIFQSLLILARYRPHLVLTSGGFVAVPVGISARLLGVPLVMHQQDIEVGLANKILKYCATVITVTFDEQLALFSRKKTRATGNPTRLTVPQTHRQKNLILVLGGSLGARSMNALLSPDLRELSKKYEIVHVLGQRNFNQRLSIERNYLPVKLLTEDFADYLASARVVISRAGMSTITELAAFKKAAVLIPLPDTQQNSNATFLARHEAAIVIGGNGETDLARIVDLLMTDQSERERLAGNLHKLFPQNATETYVALLRSILRTPKRPECMYFVGIGGIGTSALARYFLDQGYTVAGSELVRSTLTEQLQSEGVEVRYGHRIQNVPANVRSVIYSTAVPKNNVELEEARRRHLSVQSYKEYLGNLSATKSTIAVTGTHGKSTTTALIGYLLAETHYDPTVILGTLVPQLGNSNYRRGTSDTFVVEADDYRGDMLLIHPHIAILTTIDADHLDHYQNIQNIQIAFQEFADKTGSDGLVIKSADDKNLGGIHADNMTTYGFAKDADYRVDDVVVTDGVQRFNIYKHGALLGSYRISMPGQYNIQNTAAAIAVTDVLGLEQPDVAARLKSFEGLWRRFERIGRYHNMTVYSDYAHHPTAVRETLRGARSFYPDKKILVVYQPHSFDRTKFLLKEFARVFDHADTLILTEVYDVVGRDGTRDVTSKALFKHIEHPAKYLELAFEQAKKRIDTIASKHDVLIIMGAGDIDAYARGYLLSS